MVSVMGMKVDWTRRWPNARANRVSRRCLVEPNSRKSPIKFSRRTIRASTYTIAAFDPPAQDYGKGRFAEPTRRFPYILTSATPFDNKPGDFNPLVLMLGKQ